MRYRKVYGQSEISKCPFRTKTATSKNKQGLEVCLDHKGSSLDSIRCTCGSWLDIRSGKFGSYFNCINCGNFSFRKAMEIREITEGR